MLDMKQINPYERDMLIQLIDNMQRIITIKHEVTLRDEQDRFDEEMRELEELRAQIENWFAEYDKGEAGEYAK